MSSTSNIRCLKIVARNQFEHNWNRLIDIISTLEPTVTPPLMLRKEASGAFNISLIKQRSGVAGSAALFPFEVFQSDVLQVKITAGRIVWHDQTIDQFPVAGPVKDSPAIPVPANSTDFRVWLQFSDEFTAGIPPGIQGMAASGAGGWSGYPVQPNPPARRYWELAIITSDADDITSITKFFGPVTWPTIFGFHE